LFRLQVLTVIFGLAYEYSHRATHASPKLTDRDRLFWPISRTRQTTLSSRDAAAGMASIGPVALSELVSEERIQQDAGQMGQPR